MGEQQQILTTNTEHTTIATADAADPLPAPSAPVQALEAALDLTSCDREPIHIPGSIQPHGFLLALDAQGSVAAASRTAADFLNRPLAEIFGRSLPELLGAEAGDAITGGFAFAPLTAATRLLTSVALPGGEQQLQHFDAVAYRSGEGAAAHDVVEFERSPGEVDIEAMNARLFNFVGVIRRMPRIEDICQSAVDEVHALTGCDRVVLYRFDEAGNGLVLAERRSQEQIASYLDLRFPASDVPAQARRMYELNRVRIIPDVEYDASPLLGPNGSVHDLDLDLSSSILRSVSPIHRQYMRNMGTRCSMSVSIIIDGHLWGLISCHHQQPKYVPLRLRSACDFVMQVTASQIESQANATHLQRALNAKGVQTRLLASMAAEDSYAAGLTRVPDALMELAGADGAAVVTGSSISRMGVTPGETQIQQLVEWFGGSEHEELLATDHLSSVYPPAAEFTAAASGLIVVPVSRLNSSFVLWFRRELVQTVRWAGDPHKPALPASDDTLGKDAVHPRHSFEEWRQTVRGRSEPWHVEAVEAVGEFRRALLEVVLKRAEELALLAAGLQVANEELEAFSYSVSHDLRAPFRHISGFSEMLKEEEAARMSDKGKHYLATIMESAKFAGLLVDSLLDFSRFARSKITMRTVNMEELVDHEWQAVLYDEAQGRQLEFSRSALPQVKGDPQLLRQVVRNLFSNAVKYTGRQPHPQIRIEAQLQEQEFIFSVADNGVGFDPRYADKLFGVFQRLHRMEDFEGTGIGLANVRRIVGRHGGRTWAEGDVGRGATFYFSLPILFTPVENA